MEKSRLCPVSPRVWRVWDVVRGGRRIQLECIYTLRPLLSSQAISSVFAFEHICCLTLGVIVLNIARNIPHTQDRQGANKCDELVLICKFQLKILSDAF